MVGEAYGSGRGRSEEGFKGECVVEGEHRSPRALLTPLLPHSRTLYNMKVLAILYDGGKAAEEEPRLLGTTENKVCTFGIRQAWCSFRL